jgi:hypothetical protein
MDPTIQRMTFHGGLYLENRAVSTGSASREGVGKVVK